MLVVLIGALAVTVTAAASLIISTLRLGVPPMPSSQAAREKVVHALADYPHLTSVVELGSGWGGLSRRIGRAYPEKTVTGVERSWVPWAVSWLAARAAANAGYGFQPRNGVRYRREDCLSRRLEDAAVYIVYLSPGHMHRLRSKYERDRPRGGVLISVAFAMPGWTPARTLAAEDLFRTPVYVYEY